MVRHTAEQYPEIAAQYFRNSEGGFDPVSYHDFFQLALDFGGGLLSCGIVRGDRIGIISDNRKEWQQADIGILSIGAIDVPRGCDATLKDLQYILSFSECATVIAENFSQIKKILSIKDELPDLRRIIYFSNPTPEELESTAACSLEILSFTEIINRGKFYRMEHKDAVEAELEKGRRDDVVGIIFTSGTTGTPKGVMLTHGTFLTQLDELQERIYINPGERALCVLPIWHVFQRLCEYVILIQAGAICYSRPVASILLGDFQKLNPQLMPAVPRVFEAVYEGIERTMRKTGGIVYAMYKFFVKVAIIHSRMDRRLFRRNALFGPDHLWIWWTLFVLPWLLLYPLKLLGDALVFSKIRTKLGKNFRVGIAGGGAYPSVIDEFFWAVGVNIVEGYGLTETSPVVCVRPTACPVFGTQGTALRGIQVRIVDQNGMVLGRCKKGVLQVKGGTIMKGYYKRDDLTKQVMTIDGWLDTGDLAILTMHDEICLRGRMKDTIVLRGGENVEPLPIEMKLNESRFITSAVVVGQDQRYLAALIVPAVSEVQEWARENGIQYDTIETFMQSDDVRKLYEVEINNAINAQNGFRMFERINRFTLLKKEFEVGVELSAKQEIMRYRLNEIYAKEIAAMFTE